MSHPEQRSADAGFGKPLAGLTVLSLESRLADEMANLIRRNGATPISAPSLREVPLQGTEEAYEFLRRLQKGKVDIVLLLTGVGTRTLVAALADRCPPERFAELLRRVQVVARGPKPVAALHELKVIPNVIVPEPNTWREILATLDDRLPVNGKHVAVQEYGRSNDELLDGLRARGAEVSKVRIYRWELPEDIGPLEDAVRRTAAGEVDVILFTSAQQVEHFMEIARRLELSDQIIAASACVLIASIGPICSAALQDSGLPVDLEPEHPKMGHLIKAVRDRGPRLLDEKITLLTHSDPSRTQSRP